jgi:hypothetical protein
MGPFIFHSTPGGSDVFFAERWTRVNPLGLTTSATDWGLGKPCTPGGTSVTRVPALAVYKRIQQH